MNVKNVMQLMMILLLVSCLFGCASINSLTGYRYEKLGKQTFMQKIFGIKYDKIPEFKVIQKGAGFKGVKYKIKEKDRVVTFEQKDVFDHADEFLESAGGIAKQALNRAQVGVVQ